MYEALFESSRHGEGHFARENIDRDLVSGLARRKHDFANLHVSRCTIYVARHITF